MAKLTFINRIIKLSKNEKVRKYISWGILLLSLIFSLLTYLMFSGISFFPDSSSTVILLLNIDLLLFVLLAGLVIRKVIKLWLERKRNISGSGLHIKLAILFMVVAGVPTIMVTIFSAIFFNVAIKAWFSEQVHTAVYSSLSVAEDYYKERRQLIANDALVISNAMIKEINNVKDEDVLEAFFTEQLQNQDIDELVIIDTNGNVNLQIGDMTSLKEESLPHWIFNQAKDGVIAVNLNPKGDRIRALNKIGEDSYLYIGKSINPLILSHITKAKQAISNYQELEGKRSFLEITFTVIFIVIAFILLLGSVWIGLGLATGLVKPIAYLVSASEKVAKGKASVKIPELDSKDELAQLVSSFNKMTSEIASQKNELITKNIHIDERRRLIEAILAGVSSGVVNVNKNMEIRMANIHACELLGDLNKYKGQAFAEVTPQLKPLINKLSESLFKNIQDNITITIGEKTRRLFVRVIGEYNDTDIAGYVFTFDDMTELEEAQRGAAWSDVARRIAHEIKNPLTPIQLSAERLLKKYKDKIEDEAFLTCVNTIIRQVQDIGKMVDEFSRFAKMPAPQMKKAVLSDIISENILLQKEANPNIEYSFENNGITDKITCDKSQISQVMTNILKNSAEAIQARQTNGDIFDGIIKICMIKEGKYAVVSIEDNGNGIANSDLSRITEPYVTTKAKGTGIGLAIVKKIVEDHKGVLKIENRKEGGVKVTFSLEL